MANDLLIQAIRAAGLDVGDVATIAQVDSRTVQRWLGGRVPHARHRHRVADALGATEAQLWPDASPISRQTDQDEIAGAWAHADDPQAVDWRALLRGAREHIDLLGYSLHHLLTARGVAGQLEDRADSGCQIRIAIAVAGTEHLLATDLAQRPSGRLSTHVLAAREILERLDDTPGVESREHSIATSHTVLRFDDQLLLSVALHGVPSHDAPLLHLRRRKDYGLFDRLLGHFEDIWSQAQPIQTASAQPPADRAAKIAARDDALDQLDYVWRPGA